MTETDEKPKSCLNCGSARIVKVGKIPTLKEGRKKQRFKCYECGKSFYGEKVVEIGQ
jgi:transposase-like protein